MFPRRRSPPFPNKDTDSCAMHGKNQLVILMFLCGAHRRTSATAPPAARFAVRFQFAPCLGGRSKVLCASSVGRLLFQSMVPYSILLHGNCTQEKRRLRIDILWMDECVHSVLASSSEKLFGEIICQQKQQIWAFSFHYKLLFWSHLGYSSSLDSIAIRYMGARSRSLDPHSSRCCYIRFWFILWSIVGVWLRCSVIYVGVVYVGLPSMV